MDSCTDRHVAQRQSVADTYFGVLAAFEFVANLETGWCEDLALFTIVIMEQSNPAVAVRIVFNRGDRCGDGVFIAFKVDDPVALFMTAASVSRGLSTVVVPSAC